MAGLVKTSPRVAPNGRVSTKAIQNNRTLEIFSKTITGHNESEEDPDQKSAAGKTEP